MSGKQQTDPGSTLFAAIVIIVGLLLLIFFFPAIVLIARVIGAIVCILVGLVALLVVVLGILHLLILPYYALKNEKRTDGYVYEGRYSIDDAKDVGDEEAGPP